MESPSLVKQFLKDRYVASVASTSSKTVKKIGGKIDFEKDNVIIEYGPGNGAFTRFILKNMTPDSQLITTETNKKFAEYLSNIKDERLIVFNDCASNIKKILKKCNQNKADYIVSGIPFSFFNKQFIHDLLSDSKELISDNGKFLAYQVSLKLKKPLKKHFKEVNTELQPLNIPPLFIFEAKK